MSRYTQLPVGWNNNRHRPIADPEAELVLAGARAAVAWLPDINSWYPAVLVEDQWFIGRDAFATQQDALAVAVARARARMEGNGDG